MAAITTLRGDLELHARLTPLAAGDTEFVNVSHDLDTWPDARAHARRRLRSGRTDRVRKLYSPAALAAEGDRALLRELAAQGLRVRIASSPLPLGTMFVAGRTMILTEPKPAPGRGSDPALGRRTYTMSSEPALVGGAYALFEALWETAADISDFLSPDRPRLDGRARAVLRALSSGQTDEAAARGLDMSLRTYRRRVAELLVTLDAESRFQAGMRAGEWGLTRG